MKSKRKNNFIIITECELDTLITQVIIGELYLNIEHQHGKSKVEVQMKKVYNNLAVGIIDNDKQPCYYAEQFDTISDAEGIIFKKLISGNIRHYFLILKPASEKWLIKSAESVGINRGKFNLPVDFNNFINRTKNAELNKDINLKRYISAIKKACSPNFTHFHNLIKGIIYEK